MQKKRTDLAVRYRRRALRLSKVMCLEERESEEILNEAPVEKRELPAQNLSGYLKADKTRRRLYYRGFSRAFGHRLETLTEAQRTLLLRRFRDGLDWKAACRQTGYSQSGAMKVLRKIKTKS